MLFVDLIIVFSLSYMLMIYLIIKASARLCRKERTYLGFSLHYFLGMEVTEVPNGLMLSQLTNGNMQIC
jgi:hypothetical protein